MAAPRNLSRLPHHTSSVVPDAPEELAARVSKELKGWRVETRTDDERSKRDGEITISAEKGYLREFGNLVSTSRWSDS